MEKFVDDQKEPTESVESLRLKVDLQNAKTMEYLERWRLDVQPAHDHRLMSREQGSAFAKVAIQMMFLLNGGALIAFPAFAKLIGGGFSEQIIWALSSIASFVVGLVLIVITVLLAYLSMSADASAVSHKEEYLKLSLNQSVAPEEDKSNFDIFLSDAEGKRERGHALAVRLAFYGLLLAIGSLVAFVFGSFCAAWVLAASSIVS